MVKKRLHVTVSGRVQGVFFRASTREKATSLGLAGWVKNLPDGRVEALFEGEEGALGQMLAWCHKGPPGSLSEHVGASWGEYSGAHSAFRIIYF